MENFTPLLSFFGGALLSLSALVLLYQGYICGISGIYGRVLHLNFKEDLWRYLFISGLLIGGLFLKFFYPTALPTDLDRSFSIVLLGGFLVGFGTAIGGGCTSGHGVCGIGRISTRSIIASLLFLFVGILTASITHYLWER